MTKKICKLKAVPPLDVCVLSDLLTCDTVRKPV